MEKNSKQSLSSGAKKVGKFISVLALVTAVGLALPQTAAAEVRPETIIGEEQTYEDRSEIRYQDARRVDDYFRGEDNYGDRYVWPEQIAKAIELSDVLNAYNDYDSYNHSNTRPNEVLNLDVDQMYTDYLADGRHGYNRFCYRNIENKPALDAYLNLACGSMSEYLKDELESAVTTALQNDYFNLTRYPRIRIYGDKIYAIARENGNVRMIQLNFRDLPELKELCASLDDRYSLCVRNLAGLSNDYPNSFAYNGIDTVTNESAWLSLGDDELKELLRNSLAMSEKIDNNLTITLSDDRFFVYEADDIEALRYFGFTEREISNTIVIDADVTLTRRIVK